MERTIVGASERNIRKRSLAFIEPACASTTVIILMWLVTRRELREVLPDNFLL
jgi:hypothetical protein